MRVIVEIKKYPGKIVINEVEHRIFDEWIGIMVPVTLKEDIKEVLEPIYCIHEKEEDLSQMKNGDGVIVMREELIHAADFKKASNIIRMLLEIRNKYLMLPKSACDVVLPTPGEPITETDFIALTSFKFNIDKDLLEEATCKELWEVHGKNVRIEKKIFLT